MSMKSNVLRDANGNIIIHMEGQIEYEHGIPFREQLNYIAKNNPNIKIKIDLGKVDFVGSSGICHFVETLKLLNNRSQGSLSLSNVRSEFLKVFKLYELDENNLNIEQYSLGMEDDETFDLNTANGNRTRTFEN